MRLTDVGSLASEMRATLHRRTVELMAQPAVLRQFPPADLPRRMALAATVATGLPLGATLLSRIVSALCDAHGVDRVEQAAAAALDTLASGWRGPLPRRTLYRATLDALASESLPRAIAFGEANIERAHSAKTVAMLARQHVKVGAIARPLALLAACPGSAPALVEQLRQQARLLERGLADTGAAAAGPAYAPVTNRRVLYHVSQSRPHHDSGYAIRSHYLLRSLGQEAWDMRCVARFGYPNDRWDFRLQPMVAATATADGVEYSFRPDGAGFRTLSAEAYQRAAVETLMAQARALRPAIIHSASNYLVGQAGTEAARRLGVPSIYELRGMWHMTRASKQQEYEDSDHYRMTTRLEVQAAARADHVFAITGAVRDVLVDEGVPSERITLLPNAVDTDVFSPRERDGELADRLGVGGRVVVGFVGSFAAYEGLDYLIEAAARLRDSLGDVFRVVLVGDGAAARDLRARVRSLGAADLVAFTGRVPHDRVLDYYSVIDIAVYPRKGLRVCEVVSPLKPLEAMAMARAVLVSDVAALAEMVSDETTGLVHRKDDAASLEAQLSRLIQSADLRKQLGDAASAWVRDNRTWAKAADTVAGVYRSLL